MITTRSIEGVIATIVIVLAYVIVQTCSGYAQAIVADKLGKNSVQDPEFLTLNPLIHVDLVGMLCLLFTGIGWGRNVPINLLYIPTTLKKIIVSYFDVLMHIIIGFFALLTLELVFNIKIIPIALRSIFSGTIFSQGAGLADLATTFPTYSSLTILLGFGLVAIIYIAVLFGTLSFLTTTFRLTVLRYAPDLIENPIMFLILSFCFIILLVGPVRLYITKIILLSAIAIAQLLGM